MSLRFSMPQNKNGPAYDAAAIEEAIKRQKTLKTLNFTMFLFFNSCRKVELKTLFDFSQNQFSRIHELFLRVRWKVDKIWKR